MIQLLRPLLAALALTLLAPAAPAAPKVVRIATAFDPQTMDPHGVALLYHVRVVYQIHESLAGRDEQFRIEPQLATEWRMTGPTAWRFKLRPGVVFHDGTPFSADDVVFSIERALSPPSQRAFQLKGVKRALKVDAQTVDFELEAPDAVLPEKLVGLPMMSRAWAETHGVQKAQDFNAKQETHAVRNANGTGPYRLVRYEPDVKTVLERNPRWWGWADRRAGNVDEVHFVTIKSDATRLAALASGEVELVLDPPYQDIDRLGREPRIALLQTTDLGQQYLTFDQHRDELVAGEPKDRNPFRDRRVRQAVYQAIDIDLIVQKVLRGQATPTGALLSPRVDGSPAELDKRLPYDPDRARALLKEAGFGDGFAVTLDCVNVAWRENVCTAITGMLQRVGIRATLRSTPSNLFFPKLSQASASFIEYGWTPTPDAWASLNALFRTYDKSGLGTFNAGRYSNPKVDVLVDAIRTEPDLTRRRAMVGTALKLAGEDLPYIPLYRRKLTWAMQAKIQAVQWPNDTIELRWLRVKDPR